MPSEFAVYLRLGFTHVADIQAYDHILFIAALCAGYGLTDWRRLFWLATAFTVGHSVTLALATLHLVVIPTTLVETLIPITIIATSVVNIAGREGHARQLDIRGKYAMALGFGLIHGMGFSNFLRAVLGGEESILIPLFAFNIGIEIAQLAVIAALLALTALLVRVLGLLMRSWVLVLSGATLGIAVTLLIGQWAG